MTRRLLRLSLSFALAALIAAPALAMPPIEGAARPAPVRVAAAPAAASPAIRLADRDDHSGRDLDGGVVVVPSWGWGFSPYYWGGWYDPYWGPGWRYGNPWWGPDYFGRRTTIVQPSGDAAMVELHVRPSKAEVKVDGAVIGEARDFAHAYHPLWLKPGDHRLEISYPGYQTLQTSVDAGKGLVFSLRYRLERGQGVDPRSTAAPVAAG